MRLIQKRNKRLETNWIDCFFVLNSILYRELIRRLLFPLSTLKKSCYLASFWPLEKGKSPIRPFKKEANRPRTSFSFSSAISSLISPLFGHFPLLHASLGGHTWDSASTSTLPSDKTKETRKSLQGKGYR